VLVGLHSELETSVCRVGPEKVYCAEST